jgi:hypothetical protein
MPLHALRISTGELIENHGRGPGSSVARVSGQGSDAEIGYTSLPGLAPIRPPAMSAVRSLSGVNQTRRRIPISVANEPFRSFDAGKMHEDMGVWKPSFAFETDQFI